MELYRSDNGLQIGGALLTLLLAIVGGAIIGGIVYLVSQVIYLIIVFPFIIGGAYGLWLAYGIEVSKLRNSLFVVTIAVAGAVILYGVSRYPVYIIDYKNDIRDELEAFAGPGVEITDEDVDEVADLVLEDETGSTGYWGFVQLEAKEGITIGRRSSDLFTLDGTMAWIYWAIDFAVIAGLGILIALGSSSKPFATAANEWYKLDRFIGTVSPTHYPVFMKSLLEGNYEEASQYLVEDRHASTPKFDVFTMRSSHPADRVLLTFREVTVNNNGKLKEKTLDKRGIISEADLTRLYPTARK